jgi:shikimate dehydrogenase
MAANPRTRLAVLGSPIAHSKSPRLHRAAYARLGLDWHYDAVEVPSGSLAGFLASMGPEWRGLSLTMPLKQEVLPHLARTDRLAALAGAANTVRVDGDGRLLGFNTDIDGIVRTLREAGIDHVRHGVLIGGGATAASALIAMAELGAVSVRVHVRDSARAAALADLAPRLGLVLAVLPITGLANADAAELVVSTVPGGTELGTAASDTLVASAALLDAAYDPWPTPLAADWLARQGRVVHGLGMLLHQALLQVRIFVTGDPLEPLPDEDGLLEVMRKSLD